jgi:hypothetical protein
MSNYRTIRKFIMDNLTILFVKFFKTKAILWFIKYYNLIVLSLFTIGCFIYLLDYSIYKSIYSILIGILGFNLSGLIYIGYVVSRLKFCKWQMLAYLFNVIINILWMILKIISLFITIKYDTLAMTALSSIFLIYTIKYLIDGRKNNNILNRSRR